MEYLDQSHRNGNGKKPNNKSWHEIYRKTLDYFTKGELNSLKDITEEIYRETLDDFTKGEITLLKDITEEEINDEIRIYFCFRGGGQEIFKKNQELYDFIINNHSISEELRNNFSIELDGNRKQFIVYFYLNKNNLNLKELKNKAKDILAKIKEELKLNK